MELICVVWGSSSYSRGGFTVDRNRLLSMNTLLPHTAQEKRLFAGLFPMLFLNKDNIITDFYTKWSLGFDLFNVCLWYFCLFYHTTGKKKICLCRKVMAHFSSISCDSSMTLDLVNITNEQPQLVSARLTSPVSHCKMRFVWEEFRFVYIYF